MIEFLTKIFAKQTKFLDSTILKHYTEPTWHSNSLIIYETPICKLRYFGRIRGKPVLIIPPEVNHSSIVDYAEQQSLVQACRKKFNNVLAIEWLPTTHETANRDITSSILAIREIIHFLEEKVHLIGLCQGGWEAAILTALHPELVETLTLAAAPIDFHAGNGIVSFIANTLPISLYQLLVEYGNGMMKGNFISIGFDSLLPIERYYLKYIKLWNNLENDQWLERYHKMDTWYKYSKDLPGKLYLEVVQKLFKNNELINDKLIIDNRIVKLSNIKCPLVLVTGTHDHITPPPQSLAIRNVVKSKDILEVSIPAGHIGTFMGKKAIKDSWPNILTWLGERNTSWE